MREGEEVRPPHLGDGSELGEVRLDVLGGDALLRQLPHVDLALLRLGLLAGHLLPLDHVRLLGGGVREREEEERGEMRR